MNIDRIQELARCIERNQLALKWLLEYGDRIGERDPEPPGSRTAKVTLSFAAWGVDGYSEAAAVVESYLRFLVPKAIEHAIESCRNTIAIDEDSLRQEVAKPKLEASWDQIGPIPTDPVLDEKLSRIKYDGGTIGD